MFKWIILKTQRLTWPISRKLMLAFSLLLLLFLIDSTIIFTLQLRISNLDSTQTEQNQQIQQTQNVRRLLKAETDLYTDALFITDKTTISDSYSGEISEAIKQLRDGKDKLPPKTAPLFDAFASSYRQVVTNLGRFQGLLRASDRNQARQEWVNYAEMFKQAASDLEKFSGSVMAERDRLDAEKSQLIDLNLIVIVSSMVLGLFFCSILAVLFNRCIGKPVQRLQNYLDEVARGNLSGEVQIENRDELGRLAQVLNLAIANLRQVISGSQVSESLKELAQNLNNSSHQQASGSTEQLSSATQIIATMQELAQRSRQISQNAATVAAASEQTSRRMGDLQRITCQAETVVVEVQEVVTSTISNMDNVNGTVTTLVEELSELSNRTRQISKVVDFISGITDEIHLLALNAAIEAAGAGTYGERFSVVASEVKSLARRTKEGTGQIVSLIALVQDAAHEALERAEQTQGFTHNVTSSNEKLEAVVTTMNSVITETATVATEVFAAAREVDTQVEAIKYATQEQMNASLQVSEALQHIGRMAQENVIASQYIASSTTRLDAISDKLVHMLGSVSLS